MTNGDRSDVQIDELRVKLAEAEETLRAIRHGEIDAVVVEGPQGPKVYTLQGADRVYRTLVEHMPRGAVVLSDRGEITYCNPAFAALVDGATESVVGRSLERFVPANERPTIVALQTAGHGAYRGHLQTTGGTLVPVHLSFVNYVVEDAAVRCLIVSDLREVLGVQAALNEALAESQAKDEFLAMLGHELRNPLGAIAAAASFLDAPSATAEAAERARAVIRRQVGHLSHLVDDLLDVSRVTTGKVTLVQRPLDVAAVVSQIIGAWRSGGRLDRHQLSVDAEPAWVSGDETRLEQVVANLLGNALKYTPTGGRIDVRVRPEGDVVVLEIRDTGIGIPPGLIEKVFDLFVQGDAALDRRLGGLGVGLTLVRALVERHGGTVDVTSAGAGKGAVFTVRLPRIPAPGPSPHPAGRTTGASTGPARRVLVVEDNDDTREMMRAALALWGHDIYSASDGPAAISMARELRPDVAVIDIGLPGTDGYEVARQLRADDRCHAMRLIALTGYGQIEDRERALGAGFDAHLTKPVAPDQLAEMISAARLAISSDDD